MKANSKSYRFTGLKSSFEIVSIVLPLGKSRNGAMAASLTIADKSEELYPFDNFNIFRISDSSIFTETEFSNFKI